MENFQISETVLRKLKTKHGVELPEVRQCFLNKKGKLLLDTRTLTKTDPPTLWFIAKTNKKRFLKIVYILKDAKIILKTAYEPNEAELAIYARHGMAR